VNYEDEGECAGMLECSIWTLDCSQHCDLVRERSAMAVAVHPCACRERAARAMVEVLYCRCDRRILRSLRCTCTIPHAGRGVASHAINIVPPHVHSLRSFPLLHTVGDDISPHTPDACRLHAPLRVHAASQPAKCQHMAHVPIPSPRRAVFRTAAGSRW